VLTKADLGRFVNKLVRQRKDLAFLREGKPQAELDKLTQEYLDVVIGRIHLEATCGGSQPLDLKAWTRNSRRFTPSLLFPLSNLSAVLFSLM